MKNIMAFFVAVAVMAGIVNAEKKRINPRTLPTPAMELIERCWSTKVIDKVYMDEGGYEVLFTDRTVVNFDTAGFWVEMRRSRGLPACAIPSHINRMIDENLTPLYITHIRKLKDGFEIHLDDGQVLEFDRFGELVEKE